MTIYDITGNPVDKVQALVTPGIRISGYSYNNGQRVRLMGWQDVPEDGTILTGEAVLEFTTDTAGKFTVITDQALETAAKQLSARARTIQPVNSVKGVLVPVTNVKSALIFGNADSHEVMRITHDGRLIQGPGLSTDEATQHTFAILQRLFKQATEASPP